MIIIDEICNFIEDCKEKEYVVYKQTLTGYQKVLLTKKQLSEYINKYQLAEIDVYKIKDNIKIKRTLEILEETKDEDNNTSVMQEQKEQSTDINK